MDKLHVSVLIFLLLILAGRGAEATSVVPPQVTTYDELLSAIRQTKAASRERIEALVEQEKVREAWEIGKLIDTHVLQHKPRASYDKQVVVRLARDLESSPTEVWYMLEFARAYPILRPAGELSWSHYQAFLAINDPKEREEVTKQAVQEHWVRERVREEVRRRQESRKQEAQKDAEKEAEKGTEKEQIGAGVAEEISEEVLTATPGKPGTYRVVKAYYGKDPGQLVLDLGFSNYYRPPGRFGFKEGDILKKFKGRFVKSKSTGGTDLQRRAASSLSADAAVAAQQAQLFTYPVTVIRVIDGDTFTAAVDLGFGFTTVQTLRLRALDAPEIESASGREAKEFLEKTLPVGSNILVRTHRSDKYDRYLADVWAGENTQAKYVNQELVARGLATAVKK